MNIGSSAIDGFEGIHEEFLFELDDHVGFEDDPKGFVLDYGVTECAWFWVHGVVGGIGD